MVKLFHTKHQQDIFACKNLLENGEVIAIVDDSPEITLLLANYLKRLHLPYQIATCAAELYDILHNYTVALVLLDIGLPDEEGTKVLTKLVSMNVDLGIIMVTGSTDLQVALQCLRAGADDYLTKPVNLDRFNHTVAQTLNKRRIAINSKLYQRQLQQNNFRSQFLHRLNIKMNSAYLSPVELQGILQAILVGITSKEGLKFNRSFLALFDDKNTILKGRLAIGPVRKEDASKVWNEIENNNISLSNMIDEIVAGNIETDSAINQVVQQIEVSTREQNHILLQACSMKKSIHVQHGHAEGYSVPADLMSLLNEDSFVIVPLFSVSHHLGVIIADNFVTGKPIKEEDIKALEVFAHQASLAIEHSQLYRDMRLKIHELQLVTEELDRNKDMLVEAEKFSTIGHMSAQIVHAIRNPITAMGGTARLLQKKLADEETKKFADVIIRESEKVERTLEDLFSFVDESELHLTSHTINDLLSKSVMVFYNKMEQQNIECSLHLAENDPSSIIDIQKIKQVFHHLIKNGIEAMENGGELYLETRDLEDSIRVQIKDSGSGIDEKMLNQVTDAFYTTKTYGTGMGLTLVEKIIALHKGSFQLTRNADSGMCAVVILKK